MPDISKCKGETQEGFICPKRDTCYRYTSPDSMLQTYFTDPPMFNKTCDYYWDHSKEYQYGKSKRNVQCDD